MHHYIKLVCLLALARLSFTQTVQTAVTCLSDGQCVTDSGDEAVCGKIDDFAAARLPTVGGIGDEYIIRINLYEPLQEDSDQLSEAPSCDPSEEACPASPTVQPPTKSSEEPPVPTIESSIEENPTPDALSAVVNDNDRNPFLGGVGCTTPAFPKACQYCCFQTAIILGRSRLSSVTFENDDISAEKPESDDEVCDDEEVVRAARSSSSEDDCFRRAPLGFRRTPSRRFFRECNRLSRRFCAPTLQRCVDFRR